jgi:hypothetical protein
MCRNDNEIYCTEGQFSHSEPFSPFGQKGQKNENGISGGHVFFHRLQSLVPDSRAPKLSRARNRDWRGEIGSRMWQRFSILIASVTARCLVPDTLLPSKD